MVMVQKVEEMSRSTQTRFVHGGWPLVFTDAVAQADVEGRKLYFSWDLAASESDQPKARAWRKMQEIFARAPFYNRQVMKDWGP